MTQKEIAGVMIDFDDENFMTDHNQWNPEIANAIAKEEGIELTDRHFIVLEYMRKEFDYERTRFSADVLKEAANELFKEVEFKDQSPRLHMTVTLEDGSWKYDEEEEFLSDYRRSKKGGVYEKDSEEYSFRAQFFPWSTQVSVEAPTRAKIQSVFNILDKNLESSRLPEP